MQLEPYRRLPSKLRAALPSRLQRAGRSGARSWAAGRNWESMSVHSHQYPSLVPACRSLGSAASADPPPAWVPAAGLAPKNVAETHPYKEESRIAVEIR